MFGKDETVSFFIDKLIVDDNGICKTSFCIRYEKIQSKFIFIGVLTFLYFQM